MKVNSRWSGTKLFPVRAVCAVAVLVAAAGMVLGWNSHSVRAAYRTAASSPLIEDSGERLKGIVTADSKGRVLSTLSQLPLRFEANKGQADANVKFLAHGTGYSLFLTSDGATMRLHRRSLSSRPAEFVSMKLAGANQSALLGGMDLLPGRSNYFIGNDASRWHTNVPQYGRVKYENIYPGINLVFYGSEGRLEYDFQVAAGADPSKAELQFDGLEKLELRQGDLFLRSDDGSLQFDAPQIYQQIDGRRKRIGGRFVMRAANRVGFEIGPYDHARELIIDPILSYATYFGGSGDDTSPSIAVDASGNIYLTGTTDSTPDTFPVPSFPTLFPSSLTMNPPNTHVFVTKIVPGTTGLTSAAVYETFLGGNGSDTSVGIAVDGGGNAYIAGNTNSVDFPTQTNAYQTAPKSGSTGTSHVFVTVLGSTVPGASRGDKLIYSSYLSGSGTDIASGIAIDAAGFLYVTGTTTSTKPTDQASITNAFPAAGPPNAPEPYQTTPFAALQFFVTKVNTASTGIFSIVYSTYFGGGAPSNATAIGGGLTVDSNGNIYFTGTTNFIFTGSGRPPDFPILNAYQPCLDTVPPPTITTPVTCSNTSATTNPDAFIAKLRPSAAPGSQLIWSTYFGGAGSDSGAGIAIDSGAANVYITGTTNSSDILIPTSITTYQKCLDNLFNSNGCTPGTTPAKDAYVARFSNPAASTTPPATNVALTYFSYLGGAADEEGTAIAVDSVGNALITGFTQSTALTYPATAASGGFPVTVGAIQSALNPGGTPPQDAFFARINTGATTTTTTNAGSYVTYYGGNGTDRGTGVAIDLNLNSYFTGDTNTISPPLQTEGALQANNNGGFDTFAVKLGTAVALNLTGELTLGTGQTFVSAGNPATFTYTITNLGPDVATNIAFIDNFSPIVTGLTLAFSSASITSGSCPTTAPNSSITCGIPTLEAGSTSTVTLALTPASGGNFNGGTATLFGSNNIALGPTVSVSGQASDFSLSVSPANQSIPAAGATTKYTATLTPIPVYASAVSITCSAGLPAASTCTPTSTSVTLNGPMVIALNVTTTARPVTVATSRMARRALYVIWLVVPGIAFLGFGTGPNRRRRVIGILMVCAVIGLLALQPACGGGSTPAVVGGTPAGTYTITVTATSGTLSHSQNITLTVP